MTGPHFDYLMNFTVIDHTSNISIHNGTQLSQELE